MLLASTVQTSGHESAVAILSNPRQSVITGCSCVQERLIYVSRPRWTAAQRPVLTLLRTAGATAEVLAGPAVPVQLFANELHSCMSKRKHVE